MNLGRGCEFSFRVCVCVCVCVCVRARMCSVMSDSATSWSVAHQVPLSVEFSRQEYWSGLPFPPTEDLFDPGVEPMSPESPALVGGFFTAAPPGKLLLSPEISDNSLKVVLP